MTITVCVVVKDRHDLMLRCLEAVLAEQPDQIVVIDNGSTDGTWEALLEQAARHPTLTVEQDSGSLGHIRNRAVALATGDVVAFTDSDCRPLPGWLAAGLAAFSDDIGVVQGKTVPEVEPTVRWSVTQDITSRSGLFEACNVFYRREALLQTRGFDSEVGFFGEDTAAGWAVLRGGWRDAWAPDAVVEHVVTTPGFGWHLRRARGYANWPALLKAFPEQRDLLWHRVFLRPRSAETGALLLGLAGMLATRRPAVLLAGVPFLWRHRMRGVSRGAALDAGSEALFDLAVSVALVRGSAKHRSVVL
ncbi:MAG: glycosyl transferase family 2 [Frankiales bacterium]|nr:glycosyl transferase family 2 [Frankiales bacterium]